jgi:ubiquinone/menaquinone biosynthesis C-methylase UbiE
MFFGGTRRGSYRKLLLAAGVQPGDRVLDVGCGPGFFARMLAEAVGPQGSVVGLDAAPEMIEYAARKARRLANCTFQAGTAEALPFADLSFDVVVSSLMVHHLPAGARVEAVREMHRVLRTGGTVLIADFRMPERGMWSVVASITGHSSEKWRHRMTPLEPLVTEADFSDVSSGDALPLLRYVRATKP